MTASRLRWIRWAWRVATATYAAGAITLLPGASLIVFWTALLFTPLLVVTLAQTRSKQLAVAGIPLVGAAIVAAILLGASLSDSQQVPTSVLFQTIWFAGIIAPLILYPIISRFVSRELLKQSGADPR